MKELLFELKYYHTKDTLDFKLEWAKIFLRELFNRGYISTVNSKQFRRFRLRRATKVHLPSKDEGPRDIGHSMSMLLDTRKSKFESQQCFFFHIWLTIILYSKKRQMLLQNAIKRYYKIRQVSYCKLWRLLQNSLVYIFKLLLVAARTQKSLFQRNIFGIISFLNQVLKLLLPLSRCW